MDDPCLAKRNGQCVLARKHPPVRRVTVLGGVEHVQLWAHISDDFYWSGDRTLKRPYGETKNYGASPNAKAYQIKDGDFDE